ncbi:hypothetical protein LTR17_017940 [Elasticomyces elasticus]|nr:hypothetical protein LTR17_017940 [Elasticomyces elasticus]
MATNKHDRRQTNTNGDHERRPFRIAGASGGVFDRMRSIQDFAADRDIDVIFGDWMSEISMTFRGAEKISREATEEALSFEISFISALEPALRDIAKHGQKVAVNAGSCDAEAMAKRVQALCREQNTDLQVAWITGDDVTESFKKQLAQGQSFPSLPSDSAIEGWGVEPVFAQAYLGGMGIAEALRQGADIVICGRVADASPVIGAAIWWHDWHREDFGKLAHALVAGHLIECSSYVCGGSYTGFKKELLWNDNCANLGFAIAEIAANGDFIVTKEQGTQGIVSVQTVTAQLLYEIQGVEGLPPPPTTKVGVTARGGWQAEFHFFLTGLDIKEKAEMIERQTLASMGEHRKGFEVLKFTVTGAVADNPRNQDEATVDLRIFAQTRNPDLVSAGKHKGVSPSEASFAKWCIENCLQGYPGGTPAMDMRQAVGKPFFEYWVALFPQRLCNHEVHLSDGTTIPILPPVTTQVFPRQQQSYDTPSPMAADSWGPTLDAPLGYVVHGRSGDKSSDCNVGFFVRHDDEWNWLRSTISIAKITELLGEEYRGENIDRFEVPALNAVHFLLRDHLDRGANSSSSYDILGKNVCEYLRSKHVSVPKKFLDRGKI